MFDLNAHGIERAARPVDVDPVVRRELHEREQRFFDRRRKHVDTAHDEHVVNATGEPIDARGRPAARARLAPHAREVARPVAQDRHRFARERRDRKFATLAIGERFVRVRIENLGQKMVFLEMQTVFLEALACDARSDDFGQTVDIGRDHAELLLEFRAHLARPRFRAANGVAQRLRLALCGAKTLGQQKRVTRCRADADDRECFEQLHLARRVAARCRNDARAESLAPAVHTETPRKESVAPSDLEHVAWGDPSEHQAAGVDLTEDFEIARGVCTDRGITRRARRCVNARERSLRYGQHTERIGIAQIRFEREWQCGEFAEIARRRNIRESFAIQRIRHAQCFDELAEPRRLQRLECGSRE